MTSTEIPPPPSSTAVSQLPVRQGRFKLRASTSRVRTALVGMALLSFLLSSPAFFCGIVAIALLLGVFGVREYYTMADLTGVRGAPKLGILATIIVILIGTYPPEEFAHVLLPVAYMWLILVFALHMRRHGYSESFRSVPAVFFGPIYVGLPLAFTLQIHQVDSLFLMFGLLSVWMADTGGYLAGKQFGRTKLAPSLSPKKTVEGFLGGIAMSIVVAVVFKWIAPAAAFPYSWGTVIGLAGFLAILSPVGDLAESCLKRDAGVKDSGKTGTGHGGVLDRIDSLLFCLAALYAFLVMQGTL